MSQVRTKASDRREFFRINDQVALSYRSVTPEEMDETLKRRTEGFEDTDSIASSFALANAEMNNSLDKCRKQMPEVAAYLEGVNAKMEFLIRLLIAIHDEMPDRPTHEVNLSASGLSFRVHEPLKAQSLVELKLLCFPSYLYLVTFAHIVRCVRASEEGESSQYPFEVAVEFLHMGETEREALIRHILQREAAHLRETRMSPISIAD